MPSKHKISGRVVRGNGKSIIYWKCPSRGCDQVHHFPYEAVQSSGIAVVYQKTCPSCEQAYAAQQVNVAGSIALLVAVFEK